ncbi:DUF905 family protein [Lelliottia amnigena]|uniref:DUF905 family protein n=1 Tax=Lelliottia TaxID=1330545 RepID=UPI00192AE7F0|nr:MULTISPECIES: DUF905 family protein [Lelliottia]MBL5885608.1 DUF905 family protein [Lelliottia aquatilis]MBL5923180.1 DUF905 family protein [Lelliottia amnigena]MBL5932096.1 DUF905 family protein [Lelliottia amnigena]
MRPACTCPIKVPVREPSEGFQINNEPGDHNEPTCYARYRDFNGAGQEIAAQYRNVTIEDVHLGGHFRIVIRNIALPCTPMIWRYWNFDAEALAELERNLQTDGVKACIDDPF